MGQSFGPAVRTARAVALVGPYLAGKTTLLEAILARCGEIERQGTTAAGNTIGDASAEARHHHMSVELNVATAKFMGDDYTFLDCPGSVEFQHETAVAIAGVDAAVVVCEADPKRVPALQLILRQLEERGIPHMLFLNKIDKAETRVRDIIPVLQPASRLPLVLRQIPIWNNGIASGFIDLASERAYVYREHAESIIVELPKDHLDREHEARFEMLEKLADYDDELMEQLLTDIQPKRDKIFEDLGTDFREGKICPVLLGSAENGNGILRLMKALRHELGGVDMVAKRLGVDAAKSAAHVLKTIHTSHGGKLSLVRVLAGDFADGTTVAGPNGEDRIAGVFAVKGQENAKRAAGKPGDVVALGRLESVKTGDTVAVGKPVKASVSVAAPQPVYGIAIAVKEKKDEVKLTAAVAKIMDEDPSLAFAHVAETAQMVLWGQGEMHLRVASERLTRKYGVDIVTAARQIPYRETIRKSVEIRGRHKKQSGGHGQFGDVVVTISPLPRGGGFEFSDAITGGVVPKNFFASVEHGVRDYLSTGPLGFNVVDVAVKLIDGSYHAVDSSDMAFRTAGRIAMVEGMPQCSPVLLEPVMAVEIAVPNDATSRINSIISTRRGHILGFDARPDWPGWDLVKAELPEAEMQSLIVELRSATAGVGTFKAEFDHLAELTGRAADQVLASHAKAA